MAGISKRVSASWVSGDYGIMKTATDTITTLPANIYPNAATAIVGLKGNMSQSSTPSPTTPIQPSETGERTNNLADFVAPVYSYNDFYAVNTLETAKTKQNCIYLPAGDYVLYGDNTSAKFLIKAFTENGAITDQTADTMSGESLMPHYPSQSWFYLKYYSANKYWAFDSDLDLSKGIIVTLGQPTWLLIVLNQGKTVTEFSITAGNTLQPYEPFGVKIPISSASTTTPVYLGEVQTERRIRKVVFDGNEKWNLSTQGNNTRAYTPQIPECLSLSPALCTHFAYNVANVGYPRVGEFVINSSKAIIFGVDGNTFADVNAWKAYLTQQYTAGTPVCVWYVLETPQTAVVNEPLRKIGEYADTLSNVSIPVTAGGDTLSVGTTLQPSEVTVNYKGWHPAIVHERTNGAWT